MKTIPKLITIALVLVAACLIGRIGWQYLTGRNPMSTDAGSVTQQLSQIMILPEGTPTVATVVDAAKLKQKDQFYKRAENGDKVVIWKERAVIYRPSIRKIVDFGIVVQ